MKLEEALVGIVGSEGVLSAPHTRGVYECDGYTLERAVPDCVVLPQSPLETQGVVRVLADFGVAMVPRGAGTSLSGGCLAAKGSVVIVTTRMRDIEVLDVPNRAALVQSGVVNLELSRRAEPYGLHFAPDPSSQQACTIGGNIAANSGGPHTLKYGVTVNHVLAVELITPDGDIRWLGSPAPASGGLDLPGVVVGHEGTFGIVTRAWVRLTPNPEEYRTLLASFGTVSQACAAVSALIRTGVLPAAVEMMDAPILAALHDAYGIYFPQGAGAVLLVEVDGLKAGLDSEAEKIEQACREAGAFEVSRAADEAERKRLWAARKGAFGALGRLSRNYCTQDGVVPRSRLPEILERIQKISMAHDLQVANVFHAGDGNLHPILMYDGRDQKQVSHVLEATVEILRACLELGGSLTGEHGIGVEKLGLMKEAFSQSTLEAMADLRRCFDPQCRSNPNKLLPSGSGCSDDAQIRTHRSPGRQAPL